jgi:gas vesicle protein
METVNARKTATILAALLTGCAIGFASAKLPAPTEEQKAKAAEAKAKADEAAKRDAELLGKYQDRAVEGYKRGKVTKTGSGKP